MHFVFIPFGKRECVELLLREMEAQKFEFPIERDGEKKKLWAQGAIRTLPFGIMEYVFPREYLDTVLTTLLPIRDRYPVGWVREQVLRKITKTKKIPKSWKKDQKFIWIIQNVNIIPIGIREDGRTQTKEVSPFNGWSHEAL